VLKDKFNYHKTSKRAAYCRLGPSFAIRLKAYQFKVAMLKYNSNQ